MFSLLKYLFSPPVGFYEYIWVDVLLIKETPKAILIKFDGRKNWLPKAWIVKIGRDEDGYTIRIQTSQYYWSRKF